MSAKQGDGTTTPTPPDPPAEVSWQLLFWCLVPLVINTMSQPCGHFCSVPRRYRTYLRASPLICMADNVSILIRLAYHFIASFQARRHRQLAYTFKYRLSSYLKSRFEDSDGTGVVGEDDSEFVDEGLKAIERLTWLRWLFFGFGTIGPGVKLFAMKGVPWTKSWGILLLISFLLVEILVILSWNRDRLDDDFKPSYDWYNPSSLRKLDRILFKIACATHGVLIFWLIADLWPRFESLQTVLQHFFTNPAFNPPERVIGRLAILSIETIFIGLTFFMYVSLRQSMNTFQTLRIENLERVTFFGIWVTGHIVIVGSCIVGLYFWVGLVCFIVDMVFLAIIIAPFGYMNQNVENWVKTWPKVCEALQLTGRKGGKERWTVAMDSKACFCFVMFAYSAVLSIIWFARKYDPKGTQNPGWTAVFG